MLSRLRGRVVRGVRSAFRCLVASPETAFDGEQGLCPRIAVRRISFRAAWSFFGQHVADVTSYAHDWLAAPTPYFDDGLFGFDPKAAKALLISRITYTPGWSSTTPLSSRDGVLGDAFGTDLGSGR